MKLERFIEYLEGTLPPREREEIERIVRDDAEQRVEFELAKEIHEGLHALRHEKKAPADWAETWRYLQEQKSSRTQSTEGVPTDVRNITSVPRAGRWRNPAILVLAAAIALLLGLGVYFTNLPGGAEKIVLAKAHDDKATRVTVVEADVSDLGGAIKKVVEPRGQVLISAEIPKNQLGNLKKVLQGQLAITRFRGEEVIIPKPEGQDATLIPVEIIIPLEKP